MSAARILSIGASAPEADELAPPRARLPATGQGSLVNGRPNRAHRVGMAARFYVGADGVEVIEISGGGLGKDVAVRPASDADRARFAAEYADFLESK